MSHRHGTLTKLQEHCTHARTSYRLIKVFISEMRLFNNLINVVIKWMLWKLSEYMKANTRVS